MNRAGGPSPRVRGIHRALPGGRDRRRSIPAGAGNPLEGGTRPGGLRVHPRGCGESKHMTMQQQMAKGPSPRVRGIQAADGRDGGEGGSIPAGAGNPSERRAGAPMSRVHPRGCGESNPGRSASSEGRGPSPRVRGIPSRSRNTAGGSRSIPAGAGNPWSTSGPPSRPRVHPRGCGESKHMTMQQQMAKGPSPRVRGIQAADGRDGGEGGSIPAGAGNPSERRAGAPMSRVHPRGCGESLAGARHAAAVPGPSPRVRGIRRPRRRRSATSGSIPAGAGNPRTASRSSTRATVHPRGCGESVDLVRLAAVVGGPSPRVRGIHRRHGRYRQGCGSIPAGAGNPDHHARQRRQPRVHPRGCGESLAGRGLLPIEAGPSPRVRGILVVGRIHVGDPGSIPAGAGNPSASRGRAGGSRVHPRGCGESTLADCRPVPSPGPSPRVRGIPGWRRRQGLEPGSIPAGAGNPRGRRRRWPFRGVHPRGCGESLESLNELRDNGGPSPRVRGIRTLPPGPASAVRSIPAGAGNP